MTNSAGTDCCQLHSDTICPAAAAPRLRCVLRLCSPAAAATAKAVHVLQSPWSSTGVSTFRPPVCLGSRRSKASGAVEARASHPCLMGLPGKKGKKCTQGQQQAGEWLMLRGSNQSVIAVCMGLLEPSLLSKTPRGSLIHHAYAVRCLQLHRFRPGSKRKWARLGR